MIVDAHQHSRLDAALPRKVAESLSERMTADIRGKPNVVSCSFSKNNILQQAGQSMLAQANQSNQGVLSLLQ